MTAGRNYFLPAVFLCLKCKWSFAHRLRRLRVFKPCLIQMLIVFPLPPELVHFRRAFCTRPSAPHRLTPRGRMPKSGHRRAAIRTAAFGINIALELRRYQQRRYYSDNYKYPILIHYLLRSSSFRTRPRAIILGVRIANSFW